jgi:hypothetical protein
LVEPRLKSKIQVSAMLRKADLVGNPGTVIAHGDPDAGAILLLLRGREGLVIYSQTRDPDGAEAWLRLSGPTPIDQTAADLLLARQRRFDPDLWALEFETPDLEPPFELRIVK